MADLFLALTRKEWLRVVGSWSGYWLLPLLVDMQGTHQKLLAARLKAGQKLQG